VVVFEPTGKAVRTLEHAEFKEPIGLAIDEAENVYVADPGARSVFRFKPES
jgi:hypothetical protein